MQDTCFLLIFFLDRYLTIVSTKEVLMLSHSICLFLGYEKGTIVAHDWGGALVWSFASLYSSMCDKVIIMNAPHSTALRKMFGTLKQYQKSWYFIHNYLHKIFFACVVLSQTCYYKLYTIIEIYSRVYTLVCSIEKW